MASTGSPASASSAFARPRDTISAAASVATSTSESSTQPTPTARATLSRAFAPVPHDLLGVPEDATLDLGDSADTRTGSVASPAGHRDWTASSSSRLGRRRTESSLSAASSPSSVTPVAVRDAIKVCDTPCMEGRSRGDSGGVDAMPVAADLSGRFSADSNAAATGAATGVTPVKRSHARPTPQRRRVALPSRGRDENATPGGGKPRFKSNAVVFAEDMTPTAHRPLVQVHATPATPATRGGNPLWTALATSTEAAVHSTSTAAAADDDATVVAQSVEGVFKSASDADALAAAVGIASRLSPHLALAAYFNLCMTSHSSEERWAGVLASPAVWTAYLRLCEDVAVAACASTPSPPVVTWTYLAHVLARAFKSCAGRGLPAPLCPCRCIDPPASEHADLTLDDALATRMLRLLCAAPSDDAVTSLPRVRALVSEPPSLRAHAFVHMFTHALEALCGGSKRLQHARERAAHAAAFTSAATRPCACPCGCACAHVVRDDVYYPCAHMLASRLAGMNAKAAEAFTHTWLPHGVPRPHVDTSVTVPTMRQMERAVYATLPVLVWDVFRADAGSPAPLTWHHLSILHACMRVLDRPTRPVEGVHLQCEAAAAVKRAAVFIATFLRCMARATLHAVLAGVLPLPAAHSNLAAASHALESLATACLTVISVLRTHSGRASVITYTRATAAVLLQAAHTRTCIATSCRNMEMLRAGAVEATMDTPHDFRLTPHDCTPPCVHMCAARSAVRSMVSSVSGVEAARLLEVIMDIPAAAAAHAAVIAHVPSMAVAVERLQLLAAPAATPAAAPAAADSPIRTDWRLTARVASFLYRAQAYDAMADVLVEALSSSTTAAGRLWALALTCPDAGSLYARLAEVVPPASCTPVEMRLYSELCASVPEHVWRRLATAAPHPGMLDLALAHAPRCGDVWLALARVCVDLMHACRDAGSPDLAPAYHRARHLAQACLAHARVHTQQCGDIYALAACVCDDAELRYVHAAARLGEPQYGSLWGACTAWMDSAALADAPELVCARARARVQLPGGSLHARMRDIYDGDTQQ